MTTVLSSAQSKNITQFYARAILWKFFHTPQPYIETIATMAQQEGLAAEENLFLLQRFPLSR